MTAEQQKNFIIKIAFYAVAAVLGVFALKLVTGPLLPFTVAIALTVILQGVINRLVSRFNIKRKPASVTLVVFLFSVVLIISLLLVRALYRQLAEFVTRLPEHTEVLTQGFERISKSVTSFFGEFPLPDSGALSDIPSAAMTTVTEKLTEWLTTIAAKFAAGVPGFLLALVVTVIACIYFAKDYVEIKDFVFNRLSNKAVKRLQYIKATVLEKLLKIFKGYLIIITITFAELFLGLTLLGYNYALILAAVIALVDILPVLGSGTVLIPWAVAAAISGHTKSAVGLTVLYAVITAVRNIVEPKIIGDKLGVHPILMLASVFVGAKILGIGGVLIAPLTLVVFQSVLSCDKSSNEI